MEVICCGEKLVLSHHRAIFWERKKTLLLADLHLGKTGYFRQKGIAIPSTVMENDLKRLSDLIETHQPNAIVIAGDMFHHDWNTDIQYFAEWRQTYSSIEFILVPGNHDKLLKIDYQQLAIQLTPKIHLLEPFKIVHELQKEVNDGFSISGHLHPGYVLAGRARQYLRLPCFIVAPHYIILPAFSMFTGLFTGYELADGSNYYLVTGNKIICA